MTHWGVLWRTYLVVHPLLAIWLSLGNLPGWPPSAAAWHQANLEQYYYFWYFFYLSLVPVGGVHLAVSWRYGRRAYSGRQALGTGVLVGALLPALNTLALLLSPLVLGTPLSLAALATDALATATSPKFWQGIGFLQVLGQLVALPHWAFFRRLPAQRALARASG
jgi:hypothetical protein